MAKRAKRKERIGLTNVRGLGPNETIWDTVVQGFYARRRKSDAVAYVVFYRTVEGRPHFKKIGQHGKGWTPDTAREKALQMLGEVAQGHDPAASARVKGGKVADLCDQYLKDAEAGRLMLRRQKKPSTLATDRGRIERHIKPLLGHLAVPSVTSSDIERFMRDVEGGKTKANVKTKLRGRAIVDGGKGTASRTVGLLGGIFSYAVRQKMRPDNPVRGVIRPSDGRRTRRLSDAEYAGLGKALRESETWPAAVAAIRFIALTGWRSGEATGLTWKETDLERRTCRLGDTKSGESLRPLSDAACELLADLKALGMPGELVFTPSRGDRLALPGYWQRLGLPKDVTPHVLRHSFASLAADLGFSEPTIAALIGHKGQTMTSRYIHSADAVLLAAADRVAGETQKRMGEAY